MFKQSAPIIKLPADATEDDHLALLGLLNSSTACFWMKQVFHNKGRRRHRTGHARRSVGERSTSSTGTRFGAFPVPRRMRRRLSLARELDALAQQLVDLSPAELVKREVPTGSATGGQPARDASDSRRGWSPCRRNSTGTCYRLYGLLERDDLTACRRPSRPAGARARASGPSRSSWPGRWRRASCKRPGSSGTARRRSPRSRRTGPRRTGRSSQRRIDAIETNPNIALIERPEYKRRWNREPWDDQVQRALRSWLLDRLESDRYWPDRTHTPPELTSAGAAGRARRARRRLPPGGRPLRRPARLRRCRSWSRSWSRPSRCRSCPCCGTSPRA